MSRLQRQCLGGIVAMLALMPALIAQQQNTPRAGYIYPAGGRQGSEFEATAGGQFLNGVSNAIVSATGVEITVVELIRPPNPMQANELREKLRPLMERRGAAARQQQRSGGGPAPAVRPLLSAEDTKLLAEITQRLSDFNRARNNPALGETVRLRVRVAPGAAPGRREVRFLTAAGLTNPVVFVVGELPEFARQPATLVSDPARALLAINRAQGRASPPEQPLSITLPATVNGQVMPGAVDRFRFRAGRGLRLVIAASARALTPYISDAVPGWFQAALALHDASGKELAYAGNYRFHPDPVFSYEIPADGEYVLAVRDSIYRGREDFVYRISIGDLPFITSIFPTGGKAGSETTVETTGWNLPASKIKLRNTAAGMHAVSVKGTTTTNSLPFSADTLPEVLEKEPNNEVTASQELKFPATVNGHIGTPREVDVFRFKGRGGEEVVAEVYARRLDSPLDSVLRLTDARGRQLAVNDDFEDAGSGLTTHHADSRIALKLPGNGTYYLHVGDAQQNGGSEYVYRLRLSKPQPDFSLRVVPSSVNLRAGLTVPVTVYALRRDGMNGEISLALKDAPAGLLLSGGTIPANHDKVRVTLTAPPNLAGRTFELRLEGRAPASGRTVTRTAVPAEDMTQAFAYHHLVPAEKWMVHALRGGPARQGWRSDSSGISLKLPADGAASLRVPLPAPQFARQLRCALNDPPEGISIVRVNPVNDGLEVVLRADGSKAKPGLRGNLIVDVSMERPAAAGGPPRPPQRVPLGTLPAIQFEIVRPATAAVSRK